MSKLEVPFDKIYRIVCLALVIAALGLGGLGILDILSNETVVPLLIFAAIDFGVTLGFLFYQGDVKKSSSDKTKIFYQWLGLTAFLAIIVTLLILF